MKRSECSSYLKYGKAMAHGKYKKAITCLIDYIEESKGRLSNDEMLDVIHRLGDCYFNIGKVEVAKLFFEIGVLADQGSLTNKLYYAKFIGKKLMNIDMAIRICDEVIIAAKLNPSERSNGESGTDYYISYARDLKEELEQLRGRK